MTAPMHRNLRERFGLRPTDKILDVGGSGGQITEVQIDTLVDCMSPDEFAAIMPPGHQPDTALHARQFVRLDVTRDKLPFPDKHFDFAICGHTVEDLRDPRLLLEELNRVARRGLIVTPSRGREMKYTRLTYDWRTGGSRVPGHAHHHWFCESLDGAFVMTPKNYPLLYSPEFHVSRWIGPQECEHAWEGELQHRVWDSIDFRELVADYRKFVDENRQRIWRGRVLLWVDRPNRIVRAYWERLKQSLRRAA